MLTENSYKRHPSLRQPERTQAVGPTTPAGRAPSFGFATTVTVTPPQKRFTPCRSE